MIFFRLALIFCLISGIAWADSAQITKFSGEVYMDGTPLKVGNLVKEGQKIEAKGAKSFVVIQFENGSRIFLRDGEMILEAPKNKQDTVISLTRGILASHFRKNSKGTQTVKTKFASMGIRGTKYYVEQKDESTYLCVCDGAVEIQNEKSKQLVAKNEDATVYLGKSFEKTKAKQMMTDMATAVLEEMEQK